MKNLRLDFLLLIFWQTSMFVTAQIVTIEDEIAAGNFTAAKILINRQIIAPSTPPAMACDLLFRREQLDRIALDFSASEETVLAYIKRYYPDVMPEQLAQWKADKSLEVMIIDGQERYFKLTGPNLFRIDKEARERKLAVDGFERDNTQISLAEYLPRIMAAAAASGLPYNLEPKRMSVTFTLTVPANTVPEGEVLRCWLPYPRQDHRRQGDIELIALNLVNPIIAPDEYKHCSIYSEKTAVKDKPTVFQIQFCYTSWSEYFDLNRFDIKPYDKNSDLYKEYTAERETHIIFTDEIKQLSRQCVGDEQDPVQVVRKIFDGITSNYPWAGAREYSTVQNIPCYVIENKHGDCGMVGLLLIALCRYNGIPTKWQSGLMMHPGAKNMHDWAEVYFEGVGWVPIDPSIGTRKFPENPTIEVFFCSGIDSYRWIVNEDFGKAFFPAKIFPRSESVVFQRGEVVIFISTSGTGGLRLNTRTDAHFSPRRTTKFLALIRFRIDEKVWFGVYPI